MLFVKASKRETALILLLALAGAGSAFGQMNYFDPVNNKWICYPWNVQWASNWVCNTPPVGSAAFAGGITWGPSNHVCMGGLTGSVGVAITDNMKYLEGKDQCGTYYQTQSYPPSTNIWCDIVGPGVTSSMAGTTAVIPTPLPGPGMVTFHMMWSNLPPCSGSGSNAVAGAYAVYNVQFQSNNVYKCIEDSNYLSSANLDLPMTYDANHLAWSMGQGGAGATIDPASGLVTFGSNGAVCAVTATSPDVPCATAAYSLYVEQLTLKLSKEYLGIDLTGPPAQTNAISATAALTPDLSWTQFVWTLPGPCVFDPAPPAPNASGVSIKETHQPSAAVSGEVVSVSKFCGQQAKFTVVKLDITMPGTTELDEETEGGTLAINQDDDNTNNVLDLSEQPVANENDLVSISFTLLPTGLPTNQMVTITAANLYEDAFKMTNAKAVYCVTNFPLNLWLEGHSASGAAADQFINVFHPDSGAKDKASYTVIQADLDPHKLFDQKTAVVPDELEENKGGGYAILNDDDMSPANLEWDLNDAVAGKFGDDRIWDLPLTATPPLSNATMKLEWTSSGSGAIKVYNAQTNPLVQIANGAVFPGTNVPPLKVEGVTASDAMQDIGMTATYKRGSVESVDKIKLTVVSVDVDGDSNGNGKGAITTDDDKVEGDSRYPVGVFFNDTDNDQDGVVDNAESVTNGPGDLSELSDLWIQKVKPDNISTGTVILTDGSNVRLFAQLAGNWVSVKEPGSPSIDLWTNLPVNLKAEGVTAGTAPLTVTYRYTNQWGGATEFKDMLYVGVFRADLDIDSANTSDFGAPAGTPFEDAIETGSTNPIYNALKYVVVDDYYNEDNTNGIPGYATNQLTGTLGPKEDYQFVPVHFQIFAPFPDTSETGVKFHYTASPPGNVTVGSSGGETTYTPAAGNLRLWLHEQSTQRNTNSVLAGGDFIPADVDIPADKLGGLGLQTFYLEGISPSVGLGAEEISVIVTNAVVVSNAAARAEDKIKCTVIKVDVDVDSFNNNGFTVPTDDLVEDQYEDVTNRPGKIISVNDNDDDHDGIPDFADGYDLYPGLANDNATANEQFVPIVFRLPAPIDLTAAKVRVKYDASLPWAVTTNASGQYIAPATGKLRIWRKDGSNGTRSTNSIANGGDFVVPEEECTAAQFGFGGTVRSIPFFLEAVQPSEKLADLRVRFEVDPDGTVTGKPSPAFIAADAMRVTVPRVDLDIYRLEGTKVEENWDHRSGSITRILNPGAGETAGTGRDKGISLKLEPNVEQTGISSLSYKLRLKNISNTQNKGLIRVYRRNGSTDTKILDNTPSGGSTETTLTAVQFADEFWMEFERGGIIEIELVALNGTTEICKDSVRASGIACRPKSGNIYFVNPSGTAALPYADFTDACAQNLATVVGIAPADANIVVAGAAYNESGLTVATKVMIAGLGAAFDSTDPYAFKFDDVPVVDAGDAAGIFLVDTKQDDHFSGLLLQKGKRQSGGAINAKDSSGLAICYTKFSENKADDFGGGIYLKTVTDATINGCVLKNNKVDHDDGGSVVYDKGMGGAIASLQSKLTITNCLFQQNAARVANGGTAHTPNSAGGGGDIYVQRGELLLTYSEMEDAVAGFTIAAPADLETKDFTGDGGSILVHGTAVDTSLAIRDSAFRRSRSYGNGGAISLSLDSSPQARTYFVPGLGWAFPPIEPEPTVLGGGCIGTFSNVVFDTCRGGWQGGAVSANGRGMDVDVVECNFVDCKGGSTHLRDGKGGAVSVGGGYQNDGSPKNDVLVKKCAIESCQASGNGGGLYVTIRGLLRVDDTTVSDCSALNEAGSAYRKIEGMGGGLHASAGGFLRVQQGGTGMTMIDGNTAATSGGGLSTKSGRAYLSNAVDISGNSATGASSDGYGNGGGIFCATSLFDDGMIYWPSGSWLPAVGAGWWAAMVFNENGFLESSSLLAMVKENEASRWGGGVYVGISPPWQDYDPGEGYNFDRAEITLNNANVLDNFAGQVAHDSSLRPAQIACERVGSASPAHLTFQNVYVKGNPSTDIGVYSWHSMSFDTTGATYSSLAQNELAEWP